MTASTSIPKNSTLENNLQTQLHNKNNYNPFISTTISGLPSVSSSHVYNSSSNNSSNANLNAETSETTTITTNIVTKTSTGIYQQFQQQIQQQKETNFGKIPAEPIEPIYKNHSSIRPPAKLPHGQDVVNDKLVGEMSRMYPHSPYLPRKNLGINANNSKTSSPQPLPKLSEFCSFLNVTEIC